MAPILKDLLTVYWPQATLLLAAIGFFFKRILDKKSKLLEVNHSLFQENKILAINKYFEAYANFELVYQNIPIRTYLSVERNINDYERIEAPIRSLRTSMLTLSIYFNSNTFKPFEDLYAKIHSHYESIIKENFGKEINSFEEKISSYEAFRITEFKEYAKMLLEIGSVIRDAYQTKNYLHRRPLSRY